MIHEEEYSDGRRYVGEVKDGLWHGRGTLHFPDGGRIEGVWDNGNLNGRGTHYQAEGNRYEGEFKDGRWHGHGIQYFPDGGRYEGEFKDGLLHGEGIAFEDSQMMDGTVMLFENGNLVMEKNILPKSMQELTLEIMKLQNDLKKIREELKDK